MRMLTMIGWGISFLPGSRGNFMVALIAPGASVPPDPLPTQGATPCDRDDSTTDRTSHG